MKIKQVYSFLTLLALSFTFFFSCKKDEPSPSNPPTDSTNVVNLKKGLLLYLPFNGNFADSSGNNNPTQAVAGGALTYNEHGYANSAFGGTGNGERLVVTNNGSIKFDSAFSISLNIMTRTTIGLQAYITMVDRTNATGLSFGFSSAIPGIPQTTFSVSNSLYNCGDVTNSTNTVMDTTNLVLQPEAWYNLIAIFNKGVIQVYSNGTLISTKTGASPIVPVCPNAQIVVGGWWDSGNAESINGKLDEVRLYNRVLNAEEIARLSRGFRH